MNKSSHIVGPIKDKYFVRVEIEWVKPYKRPAWISAVADIFVGIPATTGSAFVERIVSGGPHPGFFSAQQKAEADAQRKMACLSCYFFKLLSSVMRSLLIRNCSQSD